MRIVLLLIVLAVIGLTLARWLGQPHRTAPAPPETTAAPAVSARLQGLKAFEQELNRFMQAAARPRRREADPP